MSPPETALSDDAALRTLADYYEAFSTLGAQAVWPYFHQPALFISPQGVFAATSHADLAAVFTPTMESLRARGFTRSKLSVGSVKSLSASAKLVTGVAIRYRQEGQELDRAGVTYVLHNAEAGWRIAVIVLHDPQHTAPGESSG